MVNAPNFHFGCQLSFEDSPILIKSHQLGQKFHKVDLEIFLTSVTFAILINLGVCRDPKRLKN